MATAIVGIAWSGVLPPPKNDSAGTTAAFAPSSSLIELTRADAPDELLGGYGCHAPERNPGRGPFLVHCQV